MSAKQFPTPPGFEESIAKVCASVPDAIFGSFAKCADETIQAWVKESRLLDLKPTMAPVIAACVGQVLRNYYQYGYAVGATGRLATQSNLGERVVVAAHDEKGRISEMVKVPLTVQERLELEAQQSNPKG